MLITTKSGGVGLNITEATGIIFLNDDWNPQNTQQAIGRAVRVGNLFHLNKTANYFRDTSLFKGQEEIVEVYHIRSYNYIEDFVFNHQQQKLALQMEFDAAVRKESTGKVR